MLEFWASGELSDVAEVIQTHGLFGQVKFHSLTSQYGQEVTGRHSGREEEDGARAPARHHRQDQGRDVREGVDAWNSRRAIPRLNRVHQQNMAHPMTPIEEQLLREMGFWKKG